MNVTMKDIADKVGVTKATVSKALNNKGGVSEKIKKQILDCCEELGYQLNWSIQDLVRKGRSHKSQNIAFIMVGQDFGDPAYSPLLDGIAASVENRNLFLVLVKLSGKEERIFDLPVILRDKRIDGAIVSGIVSTKTTDLLNKHKIPFVLLGNYKNAITENNYVIEVDLRAGINKAIESIENLKDLKIAFYDEAGSSDFSNMCLSSLKTALEEHALSLDKERIMFGKGKMTGAFKYCMENFNQEELPFDIIFCLDNRVARTLEMALLSIYGAEKCANITIVTSRGYEYFKMVLQSIIITYPLIDQACVGTNLLCDIIDGKTLQTSIKIVIPTQLNFHDKDY